MAPGKRNENLSPIVLAIGDAEKGTTGEIRVHLSRKWREKDPYARAERLFHEFGMARTTHRNAVLLYVNLKRRKFAIVGDEGVHKVVGQDYWNGLAKNLQDDLLTTHPENAIAIAVRTIGATLRKYFPAALDADNANELPDEVTKDRF